MKVEDFSKWYSPFLLLVGAILSFADPITDILTLEFYRTDHKTWFGVGIAFVILPCFVFAIVYYIIREHEVTEYSGTRKCTQTILWGFHPFSAAFARLKGLVYCLMKWRDGDEIDSADDEEAGLLAHIVYAVLLESILESAPQFIIQLYAESVQEEPVVNIQIISLLVSFFSLAWAFTTTDEFKHGEILDNLKKKHKLILFVTHIFLLSSRLFAICYFTVSYKWWVIVLLLCHSFLIVTPDTIGLCRMGSNHATALCYLLISFCAHWLRDDASLMIHDLDSENPKFVLKRMQLFSNVLFVLENFVMILLFYFSEHSNNWYSLRVTICVCLFSVLGSVIRVITFRKLLKERLPRNPPGGLVIFI